MWAMSLRQRFEKFAQSLTSYESIDDLLAGRDVQGKRRADYLFLGRTIIVEQKTLEDDPAYKIDEFMRKLCEERGIIVGGRASVQQVFAKQPDGEALNRELYYKLTNALDNIFSSADKQTRDTKEIFGIPDAAGVLVILNEGVATLDPYDISHKVAQMFLKKKENGEPRYPHNCRALIISEHHQINAGSPTKIFPIMEIFGRIASQHPHAAEFTAKMQKLWADWNGHPFAELKDVRPEDMRFKKAEP
jgi:hypothetical protein